MAFREDNVRDVRALIIGPPDTPYEFGFFELKLRFCDKYPTEPPKVKCITTDGGQCRFNPNIYANGKICLSILGKLKLFRTSSSVADFGFDRHMARRKGRQLAMFILNTC